MSVTSSRSYSRWGAPPSPRASLPTAGELALVLSLGAVGGATLLPACTAAGTGLGLAAATATPGPYRERSAPGLAEDPRRSLSDLDVALGDSLELSLRDGRVLEGEYRGVAGPTRKDSEVYLRVCVSGSTGLSEPESDPGLGECRVELVPASQVERVRTEVTGASWIIGTVIGLAIDVWLVHEYGESLDD